MKNLPLLLIIMLMALQSQAQEILKSVNEKISGKAAAGTWIDYSVTPEDNLISFTFETKKTKSSAKYETYSFDMDLNYQGVEESELAFDKAKKKYKLLASKQSDVKALRVGKNMISGQMVLETGTIMYGYAGRALITTFKTDQKVKPKGEDGSKLLLIHSRTENPLTLTTGTKSFFGQDHSKNQITATTGSLRQNAYNIGDVLAFVYDKSGAPFQKYTFLVYDAKTLTRKHTREIKFDKAYRPIYARDMPNGDMAFIFAPMMEMDMGKTKKASSMAFHATPSFKYLRIDTKGEPVADHNFELPKNKMGVPYTFTLIPDDDPASTAVHLVGYGSPDFLGMGATENMAAMAAVTGNLLPRMTNMTAKRMDHVVLGKMTNEKTEYLNTMTPQAFWANTATASGDKASAPSGADAAKFFLSLVNFHAASTIGNDNFLVGSSITGEEFFTLQLNSEGQIQKVYLTARGKVAYQEAALMPHGDNLMLFFTHQPASKTDAEALENNYKRTIEAIEIQPAAGTIGTAKDLLPKKHFVDMTQPLQFISDNEVIVLGHTSKKDLTLSKVKF